MVWKSPPSVLAAGKQRGEDTQIRIAEQPAFRLPTRGSGGAYDGAQVLAAGHGAKMLGADPRQVGNFVFGENFLSGFNGDHIMLWRPSPRAFDLCNPSKLL